MTRRVVWIAEDEESGLDGVVLLGTFSGWLDTGGPGPTAQFRGRAVRWMTHHCPAYRVRFIERAPTQAIAERQATRVPPAEWTMSARTEPAS